MAKHYSTTHTAYLILPKVPPCIIRAISKAALLLTHIAAGLHVGVQSCIATSNASTSDITFCNYIYAAAKQTV